MKWKCLYSLLYPLILDNTRCQSLLMDWYSSERKKKTKTLKLNFARTGVHVCFNWAYNRILIQVIVLALGALDHWAPGGCVQRFSSTASRSVARLSLPVPGWLAENVLFLYHCPFHVEYMKGGIVAAPWSLISKWGSPRSISNSTSKVISGNCWLNNYGMLYIIFINQGLVIYVASVVLACNLL